jgi:arginyl-tRNA synthetase
MKILMHEPLRLSLTKPLLGALSQLQAQATEQEIYNALVEPPNPEMGHLAFGCFVFAKLLRKSPAIVAQELKTAVGNIPGVQSVEAAGPYLNFK